MSGISSGVGLVSGINSSALIEQLLALEGQGKIPIQRRLSSLQNSRTALLDVNARLLNLRNSSTKFRLGKVFDAMTATSGDDTALAARASTTTPPGSYRFTVGRLASSSQMLSRGFASKDQSPLGLDALTVEWGDAGISRDSALADLNGGAGVGRGSIRIQDRLFRNVTIDLTTAVSLRDVVDKINSTDGIGVDASIEDERLVLRDTSGGGGSLSVEDVGTGTMASTLGINGSFFASSITGAQINSLGVGSALNAFNDGAGVLVRDGVVDMRIRVDATTYDISLGRVDQPITNDTKLSDLNNGVGVRINTTDADDFTVVSSTGVSVGINLGAILVDGVAQDPAVKTVTEMLARVNAELAEVHGAGKVTMSLRGDGKGFVLTDTLAGTGPVKVLGAGPNSDRSAKDLGLYTGAIDTGPTTLTGSIIRNKVATARASTLDDIITRIAAQTSGAVTATVNGSGTGISLSTTAGAVIEVLAGSTDGSSFGTALGQRTARDLGLFGLTGTTSVSGSRVASVIGSVRTANLNGGAGLGAPAGITIADRSGASFTFSSFASHDTFGSLITAINSAAVTAGVDVALKLSDSGRSVVATDSSGGGGALTLSGDGATSLGLASTTNSNSLRGTDLERQYISLGTTLGSLNFGKGVGTGSFKIVDSAGESATVDIDADSVTMYDVMSEINSRGLLVEARLNDDGDGITLFDTNTGTALNAMKITDSTGSVARSLGILGTATAAGEDVIGSFERTIDLSTSDTLNDVVGKINSAGFALSASIVNSGSGATPYRLSLTSSRGGASGQIFVDSGSVDLGMVRAIEGRDASLFLGTGNAETSFLFTSATNTFKDIVSGLEVDAKKAGVTTQVEVTRDVVGIVDSVKQLVTTVNDALGRIAAYDSYDDETKKRGPLLGNSTVARVRQQLIQTAQGGAKGVTGRYRYLTQIGVRFGKDGQLSFDEMKFRTAYDTDPEAVKELFTAYEVSSTNSNSPVEGVTVESTTTTYGKLGIGDQFDQVLKKLTNPVDGVTTIADKNLQEQLDGLNERIERFDARLLVRRKRYETQFAAMEIALAKMQSQQSSLGALTANMGMYR